MEQISSVLLYTPIDTFIFYIFKIVRVWLTEKYISK